MFVKVIEVRLIVRPKATALLLSCSVCGPNLGGSGGTGQFTDTILAGAGLTVHGAGYLSYPGEGLVKDGLSYVANAVHNI